MADRVGDNFPILSIASNKFVVKKVKKHKPTNFEIKQQQELEVLYQGLGPAKPKEPSKLLNLFKAKLVSKIQEAVKDTMIAQLEEELAKEQNKMLEIAKKNNTPFMDDDLGKN